GSQDHGERLKRALDKLDEYRQTPRGASITYIDSQKDRVVIGSSTGSRMTSDATPASDPAAAETGTPAADSNSSERNPASQNGNRGKREAKPVVPKDPPPAGVGRFR